MTSAASPFSTGSDDRLTRALGWASLGLGLPLVTRPGATASALGVGDARRHRVLATAAGVRELLAAGGLLARPSSLWLWSRVAGDTADLAVLAKALRSSDGRGRRRTVGATAAVAAIAAVDLYAATTRSRKESQVQLTATTTIRTSPEDLYAFWRDFERLPSFMTHLDEVRTTGPRTSHWQASAPFGRRVRWDAELTDDEPGRLIGWRSVGKADIENEGSVRFVRAPRDQGTEVHVTIRYRLPGGKLGEAVARYFGEDPHQQLDDDLRRLKQVLETGDVVRSDGAPYGKRARAEFPQHPARPLTDQEAAKVDA